MSGADDTIFRKEKHYVGQINGEAEVKVGKEEFNMIYASNLRHHQQNSLKSITFRHPESSHVQTKISYLVIKRITDSDRSRISEQRVTKRDKHV